jgi:hypothetical protein
MVAFLRTLLLTLLLACFVLPSSAWAQRIDGALGLGGQIGSPSGLTLKKYNATGPSYDFLAAWDLGDLFFLNGHAQFHQNLRAENVERDLEWFFGPGVFIGGDDDDAVLGISGRVGLALMIDPRFEVYVQATPRLSVIPDTDGDVGGGLGMRYYF